MKFKPKIDIWLHLVFIAIAACVVLVFYLSIAHFSVLGFMSACVCAITVAVVIIPIRFNIYYEFTDNLLVMHYAFTDYKVPYEDIVSVKKAFNAWNSPALSLDRLKITYKSGNSVNIIYISPKDKIKFTDELLSRNILIEKL